MSFTSPYLEHVSTSAVLTDVDRMGVLMNVNPIKASVGYEERNEHFWFPRYIMAKQYRDIVICTPLVEENPVQNH